MNTLTTRKKTGVGGLVAVGIGLVVLLVAGKGSGGNGAASTPAGSIGTVRLSLRRVRLGQDIFKQPGQFIDYEIPFNKDTTDFQGNPIPWEYRVAAQLLDPNGQVIKETVGTFSAQSVARVGLLQGGFAVNGPVVAPGPYRLRGILLASTSTPDGRPTGTYVELGRATSTQQVMIGAPPALATCTRPLGASAIGVGRELWHNHESVANTLGVIVSLRRTASNNAWRVDTDRLTGITVFDFELVRNAQYDWAKDLPQEPWGKLFTNFGSLPQITVGGPGAILPSSGLTAPIFPGDPAHPTCPGGYA